MASILRHLKTAAHKIGVGWALLVVMEVGATVYALKQKPPNTHLLSVQNDGIVRFLTVRPDNINLRLRVQSGRISEKPSDLNCAPYVRYQGSERVLALHCRDERSVAVDVDVVGMEIR